MKVPQHSPVYWLVASAGTGGRQVQGELSNLTTVVLNDRTEICDRGDEVGRFDPVEYIRETPRGLLNTQSVNWSQ